MGRNKNAGTVLVDMDGVLADFDGGIRAVIAEEHREYINSIHNRPGFVAGLQPFNDAFTAWQRILNLGYKPQICSAPLKSNPNCIAEKLEWLERHFVPRFGRCVVEMAIVGGHKAEYDAVALIDDKPKIRDSENASWAHIIRTRSYNRDIETDFRLDSWSGQQLQEVLKRARQRYIDLGNLATHPCIEK
jgi:5'-nucleotidase